MKKLLLSLGLFLLSATAALAANCTAFTYTLTNGTTADANQVMSNFNTLLNCSNNNLAHNGNNSDITQLTGITTPLTVPQGGTGLGTLTANGIMIGNGTSTPSFLTTTTTGAVPSWNGSAWVAGSNAVVPTCQCYLSYTNTTTLTLDQADGTNIFINGAFQTIPSSGPTDTTSGLSASTLYYIYAYENSGTLTLEASTTVPVASATYGIQIKTGDATRTLVGMAYTDGSTLFSNITMASYWNRRTKTAVVPFTSSPTTTSSTYVELSSSFRIKFVTWGDEAVDVVAQGGTQNSATNVATQTAVGFDGTVAEDVWSPMYDSSINNQNQVYSVNVWKGGLAVGNHYATTLGLVSGGTGTWTGNSSAGLRSSIQVSIRG